MSKVYCQDCMHYEFTEETVQFTRTIKTITTEACHAPSNTEYKDTYRTRIPVYTLLPQQKNILNNCMDHTFII